MSAATECDESDLPKIRRNGYQQKGAKGVVGSMIRYRCNRGFTLIGAKAAYCTPTGWSVAEAPVCASKGFM